MWLCVGQDIKAAAELHEELDFQKGQLKDELDFIEKMQQEVLKVP